MASFSIEIRVETGRSLSLSYWLEGGVSAWTVHVHRGDTIEWWCQSPFAIRFKGSPPVEEWRLDAESRNGTHRRTVRARNEAPHGRHPYTVAVNVGGGPPVIDDPEIIIEPEGD
jgi:hypothetical protein